MDEENAAAANRLFSHLTGKIVERRVLNVDTPYAVIEITMTNSGTFGGRQANDLVTYVQKQRGTACSTVRPRLSSPEPTVRTSRCGRATVWAIPTVAEASSGRAGSSCAAPWSN
ncbi:hypothetical protein RND61_03045 [Streptomyces sp. TRM76323]|uniref:Uncharacterized protein n=1 Tax=Streptomyces tamarix TaxID=3078565 RepID=A0ABU3QEW7_9ACTN|nr:hypothetical protein [Streptomyces tamarix]MDT9681058.1 hypothetical protein [Streptomyces tamarix]